MIPVDIPKAVPLYLAWLGGLTGAIVLLLADLLPYPLPFAGASSFLTCLAALQVFFIVFVWPLFVPGLVRAEVPAAWVVLHVAALLLLSLPLALIAANVSNAGAGALLRSQALVAGLGTFGAGALIPGKRRPGPWYLLGMLLVSALLPFWSFLGHEFEGRGLPAFAYVSPFWAAGRLDDAVPLVQAAVYASAGAALLVVRAPRKVDVSPVAG